MRIACPACGKRASIPDSDAGLVALCPACGTAYRVPDPPPEIPAPVAADPTPFLNRKAPESNLGWILLWAGAGVAALVAIAAIAWGLHVSNHPHAEQQLAEGLRLRNHTVLLIAAGRLPEAESEAEELENLANTSRSRDVRDMADQVRQALNEKQRAMLTAMATKPSAPVATSGPRAEPAVVPPSPQTQPSDDLATSDTPLVAPNSKGSGLDSSDGPYAVTSATRPSPPATVVLTPRLPARKLMPPSVGLTDEQIGAAIARGIDNLLDQFDPTTHLMPGSEQRDQITRGEDILCVYALMQCQEATNDPRLNPHESLMKGLIDAMKGLDLNKYSYETYARGLRATALALYNRPEDRGILNADAMVLVRGTGNGAYSYQLDHNRNALSSFDDLAWDNSNSQYGLLGVWSAAETGFAVPESYWARVQGHWARSQGRDGTWAYHLPGGLGGGTHSMTCAGLASQFVTHDYLDAPKYAIAVGRDPFTPSLAKGLKWLEEGDNAIAINRGGYDLYGLERVGLASGFKFFGTHEWYRELAAESIHEQQPDGGWGNPVETAYNLLFLARGRHPVLMNKLRFDGIWANRPYDAANLARFVGYQLERPLNWQVVSLHRDWTEWMDSPIISLASNKPVDLSPAEYDGIRNFVQNGGMLFMQADGGSPEFDAFARRAAHTLFPDYELQLLPATHPLCSTVFKIKPDDKLFIVTNGSRILMLYADEDLSRDWELRDAKARPFPFQLGTNMFIYATGKRDLRNHLVSTYIPPVKDAPGVTYRVARLTYPGNWNPEPAAWQRFARWFQLSTGYGLETVETPIADLKPDTAPIAHLTGTARYDLTAAQADAIKRYVEAGGVLLVDLCGGTGAFDKGVQSSLYFKAFAGTPPHVMPPDHPMLNASASGMDNLSHPVLRPYVIETLGRSSGLGLPEEIAAGKGRVIFTSMDITTGLLGTTTWGILGYDPNYAQSLLKNAILWALDGHPEQPPVAANR
jgi:hypothetical protein